MVEYYNARESSIDVMVGATGHEGYTDEKVENDESLLVVGKEYFAGKKNENFEFLPVYAKYGHETISYSSTHENGAELVAVLYMGKQEVESVFGTQHTITDKNWREFARQYMESSVKDLEHDGEEWEYV